MKSWGVRPQICPVYFLTPQHAHFTMARRAKRLSQIVRSHLNSLFRLGLLHVCSYSNREPLSLCVENVPKLGLIYTFKKIISMSFVWILNCTHANKLGLHAFS